MKQLLLIGSIVVLSINMAACGKEEPEVASTTEAETQLVIQLEGEIHGIQLGGGIEQAETGEQETEEAETDSSNDKKFECLPEIQEASIDSGKFQIDDMVFTIGAPVQEIFDALEKSECEYEYDYTPNALIAKGGGVGEELFIKKNGSDYIYFYVYNDANETCELKDCRIVYANAIGSDIENAYYAGKITAGDSYDDVTEKLAGYEIDDEYTDGIDHEYVVNYRMQYALDKEYNVYKTQGLHLTFDSNTRILKRWSIRATGKISGY